jgi:hypothetical protein
MSIAVDTAGVAYVCGDTTSADFPRVNPIQGTYGGNGDGFVAKLALAGESLTLVYSTYLGGSEDEEVEAIAVDQQGAAYVTGGTESANFPSLNHSRALLALIFSPRSTPRARRGLIPPASLFVRAPLPWTPAVRCIWREALRQC